MTPTQVQLTMFSRVNIGMLSLKMTIILVQIYTNLLYIDFIYFLFVTHLVRMRKFLMRIIQSKFWALFSDQFQIYDIMSNKGWKLRMVRGGASYFNKWNVCCGLTLVVLHTIAWPSLLVWILIDVGIAILLILSRILQLSKKTSTRVDIMIQGGFSGAMNETLNSRKHNGESGSIRSCSRRTKYSHEYSRYSPDEHRSITPLPTISAIRNRLSYRYNFVYSNSLRHFLVIL